MPRLRPLLRRTLATLALAIAAHGCKSPVATQLLVWVDTDIPECRLRDIRVRCGYDWDGIQDRGDTIACEMDWRRGSSSAEIMLPGSFGVPVGTNPQTFPDGGLQPVTIVFDNGAQGSSSPVTFRRVVRASFIPDQEARVDVVFRAACLATVTASVDQPCPTGMTSCTLSQSCETRGMAMSPPQSLTCGNDGTCRPIDIATSELHITLPDAALPTAIDAGDLTLCSDGGTVRDSGSADAGIMDGSMTDAGATDAARTDTGTRDASSSGG